MTSAVHSSQTSVPHLSMWRQSPFAFEMERPLPKAGGENDNNALLHQYDISEPAERRCTKLAFNSDLPGHAYTVGMLPPLLAVDATPSANGRIANQSCNSSASSGIPAKHEGADVLGPASALGGSKRRTRSAPSTLERKLEVNRAAQKRFRQRQKASWSVPNADAVFTCY